MSPKQKVMSVVSFAADVFGVYTDDLLRKGRQPVVCEARHAAFTVSARAFGYSREKVGRIVGRDQSTITWAMNRCRDLCQVHDDYLERVIRIERFAKTIHQ